MTSQNVTDFSVRSTMPQGEVLQLDALRPGFLDAVITSAIESEIVARLRKRYDTDAIQANLPEVVKQWVARLVTPIAYAARGIDPTDQLLVNVTAWRTDALAELKETADAEDGLYDLPLLPVGSATGVSKGAPLVSATASPYAPFDVQRAEGRADDAQGTYVGVGYGNIFRRGCP